MCIHSLGTKQPTHPTAAGRADDRRKYNIGQRAEDRGQRTEGREQRPESREQSAGIAK